MRDEIKKKHDKRVKDILDTTNFIEPENIPIQIAFSSWVVGHYGLTTQQCLDDPDLYIKRCNQVYEDFNIDCIYTGMLNPLETCWALGSNTYFISSEGVTVQHQESAPMKMEEYPELIDNPMGFIVNKLFPRKFPLLTEEYPKSYETLKKAAEAFLKFTKVTSATREHATENYGVVTMLAAKSYPPFDVIFDRLRGFKGMMGDLRRCPELIEQAVEAMLPIYMQPLDALKGELPFAVTYMHSPTFLRTSDFQKLFWPTYKKMLMKVYENGSKTLVVCEGKWDRYYDLFRELPRGSVIVSLEIDDVFETKKRIGDHAIIQGNMPLNMLKYGSKQQCLDFAKRMCDVCAPGGGFIFGVDRGIISTNDVNPDNLQAVLQLVHEY